MKKVILLLLISVFSFSSCFQPTTDPEKIEAVLKKSKQYSKKKKWAYLYQLYSKDSTIKLELMLKSLFSVLTQAPKFSSDEVSKSQSKGIYLESLKFQNLNGEAYFVKSFELLEKYPEYLIQFQGNLKIYESYEIFETRILKEKGYILIKTPQNQKEAIFFIKENGEWKLWFVNETERFA